MGLAVVLYLIIFPIFHFLPIGLNIQPDTQGQRAWVYTIRGFVNVLALSTIMVWEWHTNGSSLTSLELVIEEMMKSDFLMKNAYLLMSHFIISYCSIYAGLG